MAQCSSPQNVEKFVFDLYSTGPKSGCMSGAGLEKLIKDLFGRKNTGQIKTMTKEISKGFALKFPDFQNFVRGHQALMLPAFRFQSELRRSVIGESYWLKKSAVRKSIAREIVDASLEKGKNALRGPGNVFHLSTCQIRNDCLCYDRKIPYLLEPLFHNRKQKDKK